MSLLLQVYVHVVVPMILAKLEWGFSTRIGLKLMNNQSLIDLMRITEDGDAYKQFHFADL